MSKKKNPENAPVLDPIADFGEKVRLNPIGRPSFLDAHNLTLDAFVEFYHKYGNEKRAAAALGCTPRTFRKYLKLAGVKPEARGFASQRIPGITYAPSAVYKWILAQGGVIPRSVEKISEESGIPPTTIRKFLWRRKKHATEYIERLGQIRELESTRLVTTRGSIILGKQVAFVETKIDLYDLSITLKIMLRSGVSVTCTYSFRDYCDLFGTRVDQIAIHHPNTLPDTKAPVEPVLASGGTESC